MSTRETSSCGCPVEDGLVLHQRETCTDPVVAQLDWYFDDEPEPCEHDHDEECYDVQGFLACLHGHCIGCGGCGCAGYCDDYQTYNLRPIETGGAFDA